MRQKGYRKSIVAGCKKDPSRVIDMVREIQKKLGRAVEARKDFLQTRA